MSASASIPQTLEERLGADTACQLWDMAMDARVSLLDLVAEHNINCQLKSGLIHAWHKPGFEADDRAYADFVSRRYGYDQLAFLDRGEVATELGTDVYHGGLFDGGGGHLHPLKLALGMAGIAAAQGTRLYEYSRVTGYQTSAGGLVVSTGSGTVTCQKLLICGNGYMEGLSETIDSHVMPINNSS